MANLKWRRGLRIEPDPRTGDPRPGAAVPLGDPLWLLGRQWWMGEMDFFDGGTPIAATIDLQEDQITKAAGEKVASEDFLPAATTSDPGPVHWRDRLRLGQSLLGFAETRGLNIAMGQALSGDFKIDGTHPLIRRLPEDQRLDGAAVLAAHREGRMALDGDLGACLADWSALQPASQSSFDMDRRSHRVEMQGKNRIELQSDTAAGPALHWSDLHGRRGRSGRTRTHRRPLVRASLPGQQPPRWWRFEEADLNWTASPAGPSDLGQLLIAAAFAEQGQVQWRCDIDVPINALIRPEDAAITDTFGVSLTSKDARHEALRGWCFDDGTLPVLARAPLLQGAPMETASLRTDAIDNLVWLEETLRRGEDGRGEILRGAVPFEEVTDPMLALRRAPPANWFPYVVEKGALHALPLSVADGLRAGATRFFRESYALSPAEIGPRGIRYDTRAMLGRTPLGRRVLWQGTSATVAERAASSSGLRHDIILRPTL